MNKLKLFCAFFALVISAKASVVTATITDTDGQVWNNGTCKLQLYSPNGPPTVNGTVLTPAQQAPACTMSSSGVLTTTVTDTSTIFPTGALWTFTISPYAVVGTFNINLAVVGATPDLSSQLSAAAKGPRFGASSNAYGYLDIEITPTPLPGGSYYNVSLQTQRVWNGSSWVNGSGAASLITNGLLTSLPLTDGTGTIATDTSGHGSNGSFCTAPATPVWSGQGLLLNANVAACLKLAATDGAGSYTNVRTIELVYSTLPPYSTSGEPFSSSFPCWICSTVNNGLLYLSTGFNGSQPVTYNGSTIPNVTGVGTHTFIFSINGTLDHIYQDGREISYAQQGNTINQITNASLNPQWLIGGGAFGDAFQGTFHYIRLFNRALSAAEAAQDSAALQYIVAQRGVKFGPQTTPNDANVWVAHGDSRTIGAGTNIPYITYLPTYTNATYQYQDFGIAGISAADLRRYTPVYDCYYYSPTSAQNIASVWEGTNDIAGGGTPANTWAIVSGDIKTFKGCGFSPIVANDPSRISADTAEQAWNAYWRGLWQQYADGFVDFGADPNIGGTNAYSNATYYQSDGIHFTVAGYTLIAQMFAREANYVKGSNLSNCTKVVTTTYTILDSDGCTKMTPAGGSFTATFYNVNDFTGRYIYIQNSQTSGANTLTISAASGQTIDGSTTTTIANGVMAIFQVVSANSAAPAGAGNNLHRLQ